VDLSKLTKEQKLKLYDVLQEKKRRIREAKAAYIPNEGQRKMHLSDAMVRINASGNGSGKSTAAIHEAKWRCDGYHPVKQKYTKVPTDVIVLLDQAKKADDIWVREMRKWFNIEDDQLKKKGKPHTSEVHFKNGSRIIFLTQESSEKAFEGISDYSMVIGDEPFPEWQWRALFRGARDKAIQPEFLIIGTPIGPDSTWIRRLWGRWAKGELPYVECFRMSSEVNRQNLPEGFLEKFADQLSEQEKLVRLQGQFSDLEGMALAHLFDRKTHTIPRDKLRWEQGWPCVLAVDCHTSKNHVAVLIGANGEDRLVALEEYSGKCTARQLARNLVELGWFTKYRVIDIVYDSAGNADTTSGEGFRPFGEVFNEELKRLGIGRARATTYDEKSDEDFIERLRDALLMPREPDSAGQKIPKLRIVSDLKGLITDIEEVQWQRNKQLGISKDVLDIRNTDFLAAAKYGLATNLYLKKTKTKMFVHRGPVYGFNLRRQTTPRCAGSFPVGRRKA
jgi:hypothetical protein